MKKKHADAVKSQLSAPTNIKGSDPQNGGGTTPNQASSSPRKTFSSEDIRLQAYYKWEMAGRPEGNDVFFWVEAERELNRDSATD